MAEKEIINLDLVCPHCGTPLPCHEEADTYICLRCDKTSVVSAVQQNEWDDRIYISRVLAKVDNG